MNSFLKLQSLKLNLTVFKLNLVLVTNQMYLEKPQKKPQQCQKYKTRKPNAYQDIQL